MTLSTLLNSIDEFLSSPIFFVLMNVLFVFWILWILKDYIIKDKDVENKENLSKSKKN